MKTKFPPRDAVPPSLIDLKYGHNDVTIELI